MVLGSVTTDLSIDLIERHNLLEGVRMLGSRWDWSEKLYAAGFVHALMDPSLLDEVWKRAVATGAGPGHWYEDAEAIFLFLSARRDRICGGARPSRDRRFRRDARVGRQGHRMSLSVNCRNVIE